MTQRFQPRLFWEGIDSTRKLFSRLGYLNTNFRKAVLSDLCSASPEKFTNTRDALKWILHNSGRPLAGRSAEDEFFAARRTLANYSRLSYKASEEKRMLSDADMNQNGLTEEVYLITLRQVSEFFCWAYGLVVPERIQNMYSSIKVAQTDIPIEELERLSVEDLAQNPTRRFPAIIIIDDSFSMGDQLKELEKELNLLVDEIVASRSLSGSIELYIITCGGKITEIVNFATIDRQAPILDRLELRGKGKCLMASAIKIALGKLDERVSIIRETMGLEYYCPWLIVLSDGKFKEDMDEALSLLQEKKDNHDIMVYPIGVSQQANIDNLRLLDQEEAAILSSMRGFFKDVFNSIKRSENSITAGEHIKLVHQEGFLRQ